MNVVDTISPTDTFGSPFQSTLTLCLRRYRFEPLALVPKRKSSFSRFGSYVLLAALFFDVVFRDLLLTVCLFFLLPKSLRKIFMLLSHLADQVIFYSSTTRANRFTEHPASGRQRLSLRNFIPAPRSLLIRGIIAQDRIMRRRNETQRKRRRFTANWRSRKINESHVHEITLTRTASATSARCTRTMNAKPLNAQTYAYSKAVLLTPGCAMCDGGGSRGLSSLHTRYTHQINTRGSEIQQWFLPRHGCTFD